MNTVPVSGFHADQTETSPPTPPRQHSGSVDDTDSAATIVPGSVPEPARPVLVSTPALSGQNGSTLTTTGTPGQPVPEFSWAGYFQAIGILLFLLLALWYCLRLLRRVGGGRFFTSQANRQTLCLEAQLPLGPRKGLFVVRFLNKRLLLGVTDQNISLLTETDAGNHEDNASTFQQVMEEEQRTDRSGPSGRPVDGHTGSAGSGST